MQNLMRVRRQLVNLEKSLTLVVTNKYWWTSPVGEIDRAVGSAARSAAHDAYVALHDAIQRAEIEIDQKPQGVGVDTLRAFVKKAKPFLKKLDVLR
jgi:hypothetical protein